MTSRGAWSQRSGRKKGAMTCWPKNLQRGGWHPVALRSTDVLWVTVAMMMATLIRGIDYATGREADGISPILRPAETFMPMWAWAAWFGVGAVVLGIGILLKVHFAVWAGHGLLTFGYLGLAVGVLCGAIFAPWGDGMRAMALFGVVGFIHAVLWIRTGPAPLERSRARAVEVIAAVDGDG